MNQLLLSTKYIKPKKFIGTPANRLTQMICAYINQQDRCFAGRITSGGTYRPELQRYVFSTQLRGTPDIISCCDGKPVYIEIKIGRDKLSVYQLTMKEALEHSGAIYYIAKDYNDFQIWFDSLLTVR